MPHMHADVIRYPKKLDRDFNRRITVRSRPGRMLVAMWWCGGRLTWDDGQTAAVEWSGNEYPASLFGRGSRHPLAVWLEQVGAYLGGGKEEARHALIVQLGTLEVWIAPMPIAVEIVDRQDLFAGGEPGGDCETV
jgi:hypothetical protein